MEITRAVWYGLMVLGVISSIYIIIKDKRDGATNKAKRDLQASIFFAIVMFCTSVVAFFETGGISFLSFIGFLFFLMGVFMILMNLKKRNKKTKIY